MVGGGLAVVKGAMERYVAGFDAALLSAADATTVVDEASAIEKMAATLKALAAERAAECGQWRQGGARSAAHDLAQRSGTTVGAAAEALEGARRLRQLPILAGAAKRGEVSPQQVAAIADAAVADPRAEGRLVESAKHASLGELRDECARTKDAANPKDAEARHREVHRTRYLRTFKDRQGGWNLSVRNVAELGAELMAMLRPLQDQVFRRARAEGRRESLEAYGADALAEMVRMAAGSGAAGTGPAGSGAAAAGPARTADDGAAGEAHDGSAGDSADGVAPGDSADVLDLFAAGAEPAETTGREADGAGGSPHAPTTAEPAQAEPSGATAKRSVLPAKIIVRVDWDALLRGFPIGGEVCEIAGIGPVPVSVVRAMMDSGDPFLAAVVTKGVDVANVAHLGRRATAHQLSALLWRDPECSVLGCNAKTQLQVDHVEDWATTKITLLSLLGRPCSHHHHLKTHKGWAFVEGVGKRPMVAPDDPRHPNNQARAGPGPSPPPGPAGQDDEPVSEQRSADGGPGRAA